MFKKAIIVIVMLLVTFSCYVFIVNRNSKEMNIRQKVLKAVYPALMSINKLMGSDKVKSNTASITPPVSFFSLSALTNNGSELLFESLKGKKILLVNTASECGYTKQYDDLQKLHEMYKDKLVVIGFPANDFKEQEKGTDADIAEFCRINFGVTFLLMKKSTVVRGSEQNNIFKWLTDATQNGWNNTQPSWNFCKYLVNEEGVLTNFFSTSVPPMSDEIIAALK